MLEAETIIFDKTGTLTGRAYRYGALPREGFGEKELLRLAAGLEQNWSIPWPGPLSPGPGEVGLVVPAADNLPPCPARASKELWRASTGTASCWRKGIDLDPGEVLEGLEAAGPDGHGAGRREGGGGHRPGRYSKDDAARAVKELHRLATKRPC